MSSSDGQRATGFLLGLVVVLTMLFVALEWNSSESNEADGPTIDIDELVQETDMVPMSIEENFVQLRQAESSPVEAEKLNIVDDETEILPPDELPAEPESEATDEDLLKQLQKDTALAAIAPMGIDPRDNPLQFRVVEDLPQFPGGAVAFMKWLTNNLHYPKKAQTLKREGRVVAQFYVEKDGTITGLSITQSLSKECDIEVMRVLRLMPNWKPGVQNGQPCRTKISIPVVFKL